MAKEQREARLEAAEKEIAAICIKHNVSIAPKYDEGVAVELIAVDYREDGGWAVSTMEIEL